MTERKYLPTFAELVDRLSIVQLKAIFIPEHAPEYRAEMDLIMHDMNILLPEMDATAIHACMVVMLCNRAIWESESKARMGGEASLQDLRFTHSLNGVRNTAKNVLSSYTGERRDYKVDALAAELSEEYGNWNIFQPRAVEPLREDKLAPQVTIVEKARFG